ncbi:MAG: hypothetical protein CTY20_00665 [Hyphomicrobium sp.]|nr:MAG: hypothetical protein CTY20_00665 [Hyphomicrobium sp.]
MAKLTFKTWLMAQQPSTRDVPSAVSGIIRMLQRQAENGILIEIESHLDIRRTLLPEYADEAASRIPRPDPKAIEGLWLLYRQDADKVARNDKH